MLSYLGLVKQSQISYYGRNIVQGKIVYKSNTNHFRKIETSKIIEIIHSWCFKNLSLLIIEEYSIKNYSQT